MAVRRRATGTLTAHGMCFAQTEKPMTTTGKSILLVRNGHIVKARNDVLGMHQQLGTLAVIAGM